MILAGLVVAFAAAAGVALYQVDFRTQRNAALTLATARLDVYSDALTQEIKRVTDIPYLLSHDERLIGALRDGTAAIAGTLESLTRSLDVGQINLIDRSGNLVSTVGEDIDRANVDSDPMMRALLVEALNGRSVTRYMRRPDRADPVFVTMEPVREATGAIQGAVVVVSDLVDFERSWSRIGEMVFLSDADGIVLLSSDSTWRFMATRPLTDDQRLNLQVSGRFGDARFDGFPMEPAGENEVLFMGRPYDIVYKPVEALGTTMAIIVTHDPYRAHARAAVLAGFAVLVTLLSAGLVLRALWLKRALGRSKADAMALRDLNTDLRREIGERQAVEKRLSSTQAALEKASRLAALGQLASAVSHELGQPLTAARSYLAAAEHRAGPGHAPAYLPEMKRLIERMLWISDELKHFSSPRKRLRQTVSVASVVDNALALLRHNIEAGAVDVRVLVEPDTGTVVGDAVRLEQALTNILRNSIDAMADSERRELVVWAGAAGDHVKIIVGDTGPGLGDQTLESLKEPFVSGKTSAGGMGLGLAIATDIIDEHAGNVVAFNGDNRGAVFDIILPRRLMTAATQDGQSPPSAVRPD